MVRLRKQNGEVSDVPDAEAVEITDGGGNLSVLVLVDRKGTTHVLVPGDPLFRGYCATRGMSPSNVHIHKSPHL